MGWNLFCWFIPIFMHFEVYALYAHWGKIKSLISCKNSSKFQNTAFLLIEF